MDLKELIKIGVEKKASDIHITVGVPPVYRVNGKLIKYGDKILDPEGTKSIVTQILNKRQLEELNELGELDTSFSSPGIGRFRVNVFKQRGSYGMALRIIPLRIPTMEELRLPQVVKELSRLPRGLILVTGPTGSGKSTTLASMIDLINNEKSYHILTLEDPIEYLHKHKMSIVNQREIGSDSLNFANALRAALRQDPDVILVGEMRDLETISITLTAAETGHLVLSTLHTLGAAKTIDRIIDVFPPYQQQQITSDGKGRVAAFEIMIATQAIRNLIREEKSHQIDTAIQTGGKYSMKTMDSSILELYKDGIISRDTALNQSINVDMMKKFII